MKTPKMKTKEDDPNQSEAFRRAISDLEAAGDLDHEKGERALSAILNRKRDDKPED